MHVQRRILSGAVGRIATSILVASALAVALAGESSSTDVAKHGTESFVGRTVCELESAGFIHGSYTSFDKNPALISFGSVTSKDNRSYVLVVKLDGADKCAWHIRAQLEVGAGLEVVPPGDSVPGLVVSFNCAAVRTRYSNDSAYFGLINPNKRLEYVTPSKAWVIDLSNMTFSGFPTSRVYCPAFFVD